VSTLTWESALQGVTPRTGGSSLPPAQYRLKAVAGEGKLNSNNNLMFALTLEVISGPMQGRKAFHNENLPSGSSDKDKERMGYFLGLLEAFAISSDMLRQMFAGRPVDEASLSYLAQYIVQQGRSVKGTCRPQQSDPTRVNWSGWMVDDGQEPAPPKQAAPAGQPGFPGGAPGGQPPQFGGGAPQGAPGQFQPPAQQPGNLPLGGFPGSGGAVPNGAPDWAQAPAAAQPQQFQQPQAPVQDQGFPGQQFQGQVDPANFPPQNQQAASQQFVDPNAPRNDPWATPGEAGYAQQQAQAPQQFQQAGPGQLPGMAPQQPQANPNGLPQGGFPPNTQAPQATF
jgi:hypothetical protein